MVSARKLHNLIYLGFILALSLFLKIPSLFEPNHYGDEGIYQTVGQALHRGAFLYRDIWDNKPPLLYLFYAVFDGDQFLIRMLSFVFSLLAIVIFYLLAQKFFPKSLKITLFVTLLFALAFSLPFLEGNIANAENFMILPTILAFYLLFKNFPKININVLSISGLLLGLAFLFKIVAIFDLGAILAFFLIHYWGRRGEQIQKIAILALGFSLPLGITALFFLSQGAFSEFLSAALSINVGYVAWGNKLIIAQGWLLLKLALLFLFCLLLFWKRERFSKFQLLIFLWFGFSLFNALFAERPWTHYLLVLVPSFCLLLGSFLQTRKFRVLTLGLLLIALYLAGTRFWLYGKTVAYYVNFFSFISDKKTVDDYRAFWGDHVNRDYRVAQFLTRKTTAGEPVFIWGNNAQVYTLTKRRPASRYAVAYHMGFSPKAEQETIRSLMKTRPKYFVILLPPSDSLGNLQKLLFVNYRLFFTEDGFVVYEKRF